MIKKIIYILLFISLYFSIQISFADPNQSLDSTEIKIKNTIDSNQKTELLLLKKIVNINSGTSNISGVYKVGEILKKELNQLGFQTKWVYEPANLKKAPTLIAEHTGTKGKRILLIGHLDTVFPPNSPFQKYKSKGNIASGPGVVDCKGGDIVILYALKALKTANVLHDMNIIVVLTGDEEDSGKPTSLSRKPLFAAAKQSDIALDFELAMSLDTATVARRGITNWLLTTSGTTTHSSEIFKKNAGYGAVFEMARILDAMRSQLAGEKYLSFNPGLILGGTDIHYDKNKSQGNASGKSNVIAKTAITKGDLRFLTAEQKENAVKKILSIVNQHLPDTNANITFEEGMPGMPSTANNLALLKQYSQVNADLGYGLVKPLDAGARGAGDISFIAAIVSANLAGLGPVGTGAHSEKEVMEIKSLPIQTTKAAILIYRLTNSPR